MVRLNLLIRFCAKISKLSMKSNLYVCLFLKLSANLTSMRVREQLIMTNIRLRQHAHMAIVLFPRCETEAGRASKTLNITGMALQGL